MIWRSDWLKELPSTYIDDYSDFLMDEISYLSREKVSKDPKAREILEHLVFGRMQMCHLSILPWLAEFIQIKDRKILEIGAGQGSLTAPLIMAGGKVTVLDINQVFFGTLQKRVELLGLPEPDFVCAPQDWAVNCPPDIADLISQADSVVMYALLEHLLPKERIQMLRTLQSLCSDDCKIAIMEAPNRFAPWDWHTSNLMFPDVLPDQLYQEALLASPKTRISSYGKPVGFVADVNETALYRQGRGVSFHEFDIACGLGRIEVLSDGYHEVIRRLRDRFNQPSAAFEEALKELFANQKPPIPAGFARPSIDLIFRFS